jgi:hypothetical protein
MTDWESLLAYNRHYRVQAAYSIDGPRLCVDSARPLPILVDEIVRWLNRRGVDKFEPLT